VLELLGGQLRLINQQILETDRRIRTPLQAVVAVALAHAVSGRWRLESGVPFR